MHIAYRSLKLSTQVTPSMPNPQPVATSNQLTKTPPTQHLQVANANKKNKASDSKGQKKNELSKELIEKFIRGLSNNFHVTNLPFWESKYQHISDKYKVDLNYWLKENWNNLPDYDWGKKVSRMVQIGRDKSGKLQFYKTLLSKKFLT